MAAVITILRRAVAGVLAALCVSGAPACGLAAGLAADAWPSGAPGGDVVETVVRFASTSPFTLVEVDGAPPVMASGYYVVPADAPAHAERGRTLPAVVLLHGAGGVLQAREITYARQLARQGVAALVIDAFSPRRDRATSFTDRLIQITETMLLADAFAGLGWLAARPEIDSGRVALIGFSYGGMASTFAAYRQVADRLAPDGRRFAAHVAFYGPCIARFAAPETTGAPVLMLWGGRDEIVDATRCDAVADDLRRGGSRVDIRVFPDGAHQWDGGMSRPWRTPRGLAGCALSVSASGAVHDRLTHLPMRGPRTRALILAACADQDGYVIQRDDAVRTQSNRALSEFLSPVLFTESAAAPGEPDS